MTCGIYEIKNCVNGKVYIGSSKNIEGRLREHRRKLKLGKHENIHLQNAWNKYGEKSFTMSFIQECSEDELQKVENELMSLRGSLSRSVGYNILPAERKVLVVSKEYSLALSEKAKRFWNSPRGKELKSSIMKSRYSCIQERALQSDRIRTYCKTSGGKLQRSNSSKVLWRDNSHRLKVSNSLKKFYSIKENREKISENNRKRYERPEEREKTSNALKEHYKTEEARVKASDRNKKIMESEEVRQKISGSLKEFYSTEEGKKKKSEALQKRYENPEEREKTARALKEFYSTEEGKKKKSEAVKKAWETRRRKKKELENKG